jgi:hypothetical protein
VAGCAHTPTVVAPADYVPVVGDPFAGCKAKLDTPFLMLTCADAGVMVVSMAANGEPQDVLAGGMSLMKAKQAVVDDVPRPGGPALRVYRTTTSVIGPIVATVVTRRPGLAEFVACAAVHGGCEARLVAVVDGGLPDLQGRMDDWKAPEPFPGRTLTVPPGCEPLADGGSLPGFACGIDVLGGAVLSGEATPEENLAATVAARAKSAKENGTTMVQLPVKCQVDGVPGVCSFTTRPPHTPYDPPHDVLGYALRPDGTQIVADCRWGGAADAIPAFCGQLLTWTPAVR